MSKILSANFYRLFRDKVLWISALFMMAIGAYGASVIDEGASFDGLFFRFTLFLIFTMAAFCTMYIGTEYSDGTLRNKLIIGHKRSRIYFANLYTCLFAAILLIICYLIPVCLIGLPRLGSFEGSCILVTKVLALAILTTFATVSFLTMFSMIIENKSINIAVCILGTLFLLIVSYSLDSRLKEEPYYSAYSYIDESGEVIEVPEEPNSMYITGTKREVYENILDFLPEGQAIKIAFQLELNPERMALYSLGVIIFFNFVGLIIFKKKDIR